MKDRKYKRITSECNECKRSPTPLCGSLGCIRNSTAIPLGKTASLQTLSPKNKKVAMRAVAKVEKAVDGFTALQSSLKLELPGSDNG